MIIRLSFYWKKGMLRKRYMRGKLKWCLKLGKILPYNNWWRQCEKNLRYQNRNKLRLSNISTITLNGWKFVRNRLINSWKEKQSQKGKRRKAKKKKKGKKCRKNNRKRNPQNNSIRNKIKRKEKKAKIRTMSQRTNKKPADNNA